MKLSQRDLAECLKLMQLQRYSPYPMPRLFLYFRNQTGFSSNFCYEALVQGRFALFLEIKMVCRT